MSEPDPPRQAPSIVDLVSANLKVLAVVVVLAGGAFLLWKGLAALFPEQAWLQGPAG